MKSDAIMDDEKTPIIINVQCVTGTGLIYLDIKHFLRKIGQTLWLMLSTIFRATLNGWSHIVRNKRRTPYESCY